MTARKKTMTMLVTVSVPAKMTAAEVRREVRTRINDLTCWEYDMCDEKDMRAVKVAPGARAA